jgi:hypothetical protein
VAFFGSGRKHSIIKPAVLADYDQIQVFLNTSGFAFDATNGLQVATPASSAGLITLGGHFRNLRMVAELAFLSGTNAGAEDIAIVLNWNGNSTPGGRNYIMARQINGEFRITRVSNGSGATVGTGQTKSLAQGTFATFEIIRKKTSIQARIDGGAWITGTILESSVPYEGCFGFRTSFGGSNSTFAMRSFTCEAWG